MFSPIRADRSHSGGHWQDRSLVRTLLLHSWLQMEQYQFTWLILASCSGTSVSMVLWCQRRPSGLDNYPPPPPPPHTHTHTWLDSSIICEPESCVPVCLPTPGWSAGCPLTCQMSSAAEMAETQRNVHYMCSFSWHFSYIITREGCVGLLVCV